MNTSKLESFIKGKAERQEILQKRKLVLEKHQIDLKKSGVFVLVKGLYYSVKRFFLVCIALVLLIGGISIAVSPRIILNIEDVEKEMVRVYKESYEETAGKTFAEATLNLAISGKIGVDNYLKEIDKSLERTALVASKKLIITVAFLVVILGLVLLYISRLTNKLKKRNNLLKDSEKLTKNILSDYKKTIDEEKVELQLMKEFLNSQTL